MIMKCKGSIMSKFSNDFLKITLGIVKDSKNINMVFFESKILLPNRCVLQMHFQTWPNCLTFHKWNAALGAVQPKSWMNTFAKKPTVLTTG